MNLSPDLAWILVYEVLLDTDNCMERTFVRLTRFMETLVAARNVRPYESPGDTSPWSVDTGPWSIRTLTRSVRLYERRWETLARGAAAAACQPPPHSHPSTAHAPPRTEGQHWIFLSLQHSFCISAFLRVLSVFRAFRDPFQFEPMKSLIGAASVWQGWRGDKVAVLPTRAAMSTSLPRQLNSSQQLHFFSFWIYIVVDWILLGWAVFIVSNLSCCVSKFSLQASNRGIHKIVYFHFLWIWISWHPEVL